jgi:formate hydrogenlyase transcriptional activator
MELHPGPEKRRVSTVRLAELEPIQQALHDNEDWYQDLVEHSRDLLCIHDLKGRLLLVNSAPARVLGYSVEEILEIPMRDLIAPEFRDQFDAYMSQIERLGEASGLLTVVTRSGERRIWEYHNTLRREGVTSPIVRGLAHDITEQKRAEKLAREASQDLLDKVRESERTIRELKLFRTLVDQSNDAIEVLDPETLRFLDVNEKACVELGYSREELLSLGVFDIDPAATEASAARINEELRQSGRVVTETVHRRKDGMTFAVEVSMTWVRLERDYIVAISRDLTERNLADTRLRASQNRYRAVHDRSPVGICWVETRTGRLLGVNPKYCEILGRTEEDLLSCNFQSLTHPDDLAMNLEKLRQLADGEVRSYKVEKRYLRPDGSVCWAEVEVVPMWPEGEEPVWHMAIVQDVTERRRWEEALQTSERRQHQIASQLEAERARLIEAQAVAKVGSWEAEWPSVEVTWSEQTHRIFETDPSHFHPTRPDFVKFIHPQDRARVDAAFQASLDKGAPSNVEYRIVMADGRVKVLEEQWRVFHDGQGRPIRLMGTCRDITERKRADAALQSAKAFSENLIQTANAIILSLDREGNVVLFNQAAEEITGYRFPELKDRNWSILVPRDRFPYVWDEFDRLIGGTAGKTFENPIVTKTGEERYIAWSNNPVKVNGEIVGTISFGSDITDRREAEQSLRRSEQNYRLFVSQSSEGIFREEMDVPIAIDLPEDELIHHILHDGYIAESNDALAKMYGTTLEKVRGMRLTEIVVANDPRNIELTREFIRSGFRLLERESHEVDKNGNPKVFANSMIGTVENRMLVRIWRIQRDITERVKLEESRKKAEEALRRNVAQLQAVTEELRLAKEKLSEEKLYLEKAIDTELGFGEIVGRSSAMKEVMEKVARVAASDATVLLLGETGTGKELVARALHHLSKRQGKSFIKLNCAAIPSGLLESELFGHEKGAFTGAVARKPGRLELADGGTLFLDEIGEIPLSLQPKLLRVLQDMEFERLGGTQTLKVNFRLLAATNRDLLRSMSEREFRSDLYYRLNVFPIHIPPLRERREDIRPLVEHFVRKFATQMKKSITSIPSKTMEMLVRWDWPGNIRELENFVERSVILTPGSVLQSPLSELTAREETGGKNVSLRDKERERILSVLGECRGKLGGPDGAAARLGLKRTTLQSKLDQLGIKPGTYRK